MGREFKQKEATVLEQVMKQCLEIVGAKLEENQIKLLLRLYTSGIAYHYFLNPDDLIDVGFLRFGKSPEKEELFKVTLIRDEDSGVVNAKTLWKYYKGDLSREQQFKNILDSFLKNLINYSQQQEIEITKSISKIEKRKEKKED